jgi:sialate O-acetylesterase
MNKHFYGRVLVCCGVLLAAWPCCADVKMPAIFGDHMLLQQDIKIPVWGWADAGEAVTVSIGNRSGKTVAGADGKWRVNLEPLPSNAAPQTLTVAGKNNLKFEDVLVGDVWVCSGQSNMEFGLGGSHSGREDQPKASDPQIRLFRVPHTDRAEPQADVNAKWEVCTPQTAGGFSAVAYYFAREIKQSLNNRPIGLIGTYWGGTPAQSWVSLSGLQKDPPFTGYIQQSKKDLDYYLANKDAYPQLVADYEAARNKWNAEIKPTYDPILKAWTEEVSKAKAAGLPLPPKPSPSTPEPQAPRSPNPTPGHAASLFNGMIAPLIPFAIKGAIWYQGESNAGNATEYRTLFPRLISDWREKWGQGDFPFLFVQLAGFGGGPGKDSYPLLREAQLQTLALPNTGMAVAMDIGEEKDIHPKDKKDVGLRLAQAAKSVAYGQNVVLSGPMYDSMKVEGNKIRLTFKHVGSGLTIGAAPWSPSGPPVPAAELQGFIIAGADNNFVPAKAAIEGNSVVVWSDQVSAPVAVRYGWAGFTALNLYNKEGLPASPFRTDDGRTAERAP